MISLAVESRILVFGLNNRSSDADLRPLLGCSADVRIELCPVPGHDDQTYAVLHLQPDPGHAWRAWRMADGIRQRRLHGRRLQAWVPAMPWA